MEKNILILTHGRFGEALLQSVEMIVGSVNHVISVPLMPGVSPEQYHEQVLKKVHHLSSDTEILCLVDLFGGSPCNIALRINYDRRLRIVSGLSLPLLIEAISQRDALTMDELVETIVEASKDGCFDVLPKNAKEEQAWQK